MFVRINVCRVLIKIPYDVVLLNTVNTTNVHFFLFILTWYTWYSINSVDCRAERCVNKELVCHLFEGRRI